MILIGASVFSLVFRGYGGDVAVRNLLESLPGGVIGAVMVVMLIMFLLGFVLDFIEITFVVVPIVGPVLLAMGLDPVWLAIMIAINLQTSFLTPPFGFALFYLRGVAPPTVSTGQIYRGVIPFVAIQIFALIILAIIGLPVTVILAWAYEITIRGIVRHEETRGGAPRLAFLPFILLVITVSGGFGYGVYYLSLGYQQPEIPSLAVLPFVNMSGAEDGDYFSDGLTEEIQNLMVRMNEFRVVALSSTYELKDKSIDIPTIAKRLDVGLLLQGSVRRSGDQVRITAKLIDGEDGTEIWSDNYDRKLSNIFAIQESIAREVAAALQIVLPVSLERRLVNLGTVNVEAYDLYLRATDFLRQPTDDATLARTESYIRQAIAIDPNFARPYAAWCEVHLIRYERSRATTYFEDAERACHRALTRDTADVDVHLALGRLYVYSGQYNQSITEFEAALKTNANLADAHIGLADVYEKLNRPAEAEANLRRAIALDASYWASFNKLGTFLFAAGRYLEAAEFFQEYARRTEDNATAYNNLGAAYFLAGD